MARSRRDVDTLNTHARACLIARGVVHGPVLLDGEREWRAGDQLRATRNNRTIAVGDGYLSNGDSFTVLARSRGGILAEHSSGARIILPARYVRQHATYGWASTVDSAQGATVDVGILLARPGIDREHLYVGLTRGRQANHVHLAPGEISDDHHLQVPTRADNLDAVERALTDALARSGRQSSAYARLPETRPHPATEPITPAGRALDEALRLERNRAQDRGMNHDLGR